MIEKVRSSVMGLFFEEGFWGRAVSGGL